MGEVASVFQTRRFGVESTAFTAVPATKMLQSMSFGMEMDPSIENISPDGRKTVVGTVLNRNVTNLSLEGRPSYDEITYALAMILGEGTKTNPNGTAYQRVIQMLPSAPDPIKTLSLDMGAGEFWYRSAGGHLQELSIKVNKSSGVEVSGSGKATEMNMSNSASSSSATYIVTITGSPTGGTFTLTKGTPTGTIAYNATAAAVQTALEALASVGVGNVAVTGGTGGPYTVSFTGALADTPITLTGTASLTGGTTPNVTVVAGQTGQALTTLTLKPMLLKHFDLYQAATAAGLDAAQPLSRAFNYEFKIGNKSDIVQPIRSTVTSFDGIAEGKPDITVSLQLAADAVGRAFATNMAASSTTFIRLKGVGEAIGATNQFYTFQIDTPVQVKAGKGPSDSDKLFVLDWDLQCVEDLGGLGSDFKITLINSVNTL